MFILIYCHFCLFYFIYINIFLFVYFICLYLYFYCNYFWETTTFCKTTLIFAYLIKDIVLGQTLWGTNTFPTRNRLPNLKSNS